MNYIETLGYTVYSDELSKINLRQNSCKIINTISPNSYGVAIKDNEFEKALKSSNFLVLDGVYFAIASILLNGKNIKRNQGPDVFQHFMQRLNEEHKKAFFLGSSEATLQKIKDNAKQKFPNITIETYSPPFKSEFSLEENKKMVSVINQFHPDILFIGMTCPKQEKWAVKHREQLQTNLAICIGNVFDWFAGTQKTIHPFWFKLRLGWFIRIFLRPEVFRRNIGNQMLFFWHTILVFLRLKRIN